MSPTKVTFFIIVDDNELPGRVEQVYEGESQEVTDQLWESFKQSFRADNRILYQATAVKKVTTVVSRQQKEIHL